jgi:hypothetical protein
VRRADIGAELDALDANVREGVQDLLRQYQRFNQPALLKQAIDTPRRTRAQLAAWIARHDAARSNGAAVAFLASCLTAAGAARSLAQINQALVTLETAAQQLIALRNGGATWDAVATACATAFTPSAPESEDFAFRGLPVPPAYVTAWGEPW